MIDFTNKTIIKLKEIEKDKINKEIMPLLINGEEVIAAYKTMRDFVVFTNLRIISVNVQGVTGSKKDFTSLPYSKVQTFSIETSGVFDLDSELDLVFSGLGTIRFEFTGKSNIVQIGKQISSFILR